MDLRPLNTHCADLPVKYDKIADVRALFNSDLPVTYLGAIDITDGYHHFSIASEFRKFF